MKRIRPIEGEILDRYYERLNTKLEYNHMWDSLSLKAEPGGKSEKGYQMIAKSMSGRIARNLGYNSNKAEVLSMCVGSYFPRYGAEGKKVIEQYIRREGLDIDVSTLATDCIEHSISKNDAVAVDLDEALKEYFGGGNSIPEVEIVRISQNTISAVKRIEALSKINGGDLLYRVSEDIIEASKAKKMPMPSAKLQEMEQKLPQGGKITLTEEEKAEMVEGLDRYVKTFGNEGIYNYINSDGRI